jgi:hypothetical protein
MTKHTNGPWRVTTNNGLPDAVVASDADLGSVGICKIVLLNDHEANARLIAAAPDMFDALWRARKLLLSMSYAHSDEYAVIEAALSKATA